MLSNLFNSTMPTHAARLVGGDVGCGELGFQVLSRSRLGSRRCVGPRRRPVRRPIGAGEAEVFDSVGRLVLSV